MASPDEPLDGIASHFAHAADETEWVPLSLTLVEYPQGTNARCLPRRTPGGPSFHLDAARMEKRVAADYLIARVHLPP